MDVKLAALIKSLNIMDVIFSGFTVSCPASWLFRLLLSASYLVVAMIF